MKIKLNDLIGEEQAYDWEVPSSWVSEALASDAEGDELEAELFEADGALSYAVSVYRNEQDVFYRATLSGGVTGTCVRCLEKLAVPMELEWGGMYCVPGPDDAEEPDDPSHYFYNGEEMDFGLALKEQMFLNLPLNPTCEQFGEECGWEPEPAHRGEGFEDPDAANKVDSRWAALLKIKEDMDKK